MANEPTNIDQLLQMLNQSAPVTEAPPGTFDVGSIEPFNPIMDRYKPNPLDEFAMMMVGPTSKARLTQLANPTDDVEFTVTIDSVNALCDDIILTEIFNLSTVPVDCSLTTADINSGRYVYDVELVLADSTIEKVHYGLITVHPEATKI